MAIEQTLSIIKPDAVGSNVIGEVLTHFESRGLRIAAAKLTRLTREKAEGFYIEHKERPFFESLVHFMTSGPVLLLALEGEDAIARTREIMGVTDPAKASKDTIRKKFGKSIESNAIHGSDSVNSAKREVAYFFDKSELYRRY